MFAAVIGFGRCPEVESAAVDPDQHGNAFLCRFRRRPNIQVQTVLALSRWRIPALDGAWCKLVSLEYTIPFCGGLRSAPAEVANRRRGEWDTFQNRQSVFGRPLYQSAIDFHE